jgi:LytS/YehU family sensor histidine kinase
MINVVLWLLFRQRKLNSQKQLLEAEKNKIELEQRLLRTQMEPHFIFNTLNTMQSLVRSNENEKAIFYLNKFSRLLRISLENSRENYVLLSEEVEALQHYISLQAIALKISLTIPWYYTKVLKRMKLRYRLCSYSLFLKMLFIMG